MPQLTLNHATIADVQMDEQDSSRRIVKINVDEEDFFEMLDHVNPKNIIKYLDMRKIPHREALQVNVKPIELQQLPDRHSPQYGDAIRKLRKLEANNDKKLNRLRGLITEYCDKRISCKVERNETNNEMD